MGLRPGRPYWSAITSGLRHSRKAALMARRCEWRQMQHLRAWRPKSGGQLSPRMARRAGVLSVFAVLRLMRHGSNAAWKNARPYVVKILTTGGGRFNERLKRWYYRFRQWWDGSRAVIVSIIREDPRLSPTIDVSLNTHRWTKAHRRPRRRARSDRTSHSTTLQRPWVRGRFASAGRECRCQGRV